MVRARHLLRWGSVLCVCIGMWSASAIGATQSATTVVTATIVTSTTLDPSGCAPGIADSTSFGVVLPRDKVASTPECEVIFGSSLPNATLRIAQSDGRGVGMYQYTTGELDTGFDTDGRNSSFGGAGGTTDAAYGVASQADGRVVVVGYCDMGATGLDMCVSRYTTAGALDPSFDTDGKVTTIVSPGLRDDQALGVVVQADQRIIVFGACHMGPPTNYDVCLARYNVNGSLDTTFDVDGVLNTPVGPGLTDQALAGVLQPDGRLVVAGNCYMGGATGWDVCLVRYNTDGSLDTSFHTDGIATTAIAPGAGEDLAHALALQDDGKLVAAGYCDMGGATGRDSCLVRYNNDGSLDMSFDVDGRVTTAAAPGVANDAAHAVAVQADGRIVTAGDCSMGGATGDDYCLARYTTIGGLDASFDTDGRVTTDIAPGAAADNAHSIAVQSDGKIVASGYCNIGGATGYDGCVARYDTDGSLDTTFDADGRVNVPMGPGGGAADYPEAMALNTDGRIVIAGLCGMPVTGPDMCVAQLGPGGVVDPYAFGSKDWETDPDSGFFGMCLINDPTSDYTPSIPTHATCPMVDGVGTYWRPVAPGPVTLGVANSLAIDAPVKIRFGLKYDPLYPVGDYTAPVTFELVTP